MPTALLGGAAADEPAPGVTLSSLKVAVNITDHYAVTQVTTLLRNDGSNATEFTIHLAASHFAFITRFAIEVNGTVYESTIGNASQAREAYNNAVSSGRQAGLVELRDTHVMLLALSVPAQTALTAHLSYEEMVYRQNGEYLYAFPLYATAAGQVIDNLGIEGTVAGHSAITQQSTSSGSVLSLGGTSFSFAAAVHSRVPDDNFTVRWREDSPVGAGFFITHSTDEAVYFVHVFSADGAGLASAPLPKDIVFVIDRSGSMSGLKMDQARTAARGMLDDLREGDRFSVVSFDDTIETWRDQLESANATEVEAAKSWVTGINARGSTNIDGGLQRSIEMLGSAPGRAPIVVFLTDGQPTAGVTDLPTIRSNLLARNTVGAAVFTLAFGGDADVALLRQIAAENHGEMRQIYLAQDAALQIQGFYDTFGTPALQGVNATYSAGGKTIKLEAGTAAYAGSNLVFAGALPAGSTSVHVEVRGTASTGPATFSGDYSLAATEAGFFVERAAAYQQIRALERGAVLGNAQAKADIVSLATKYHFVTEYTSLVIVVPEEFARLNASGLESGAAPNTTRAMAPFSPSAPPGSYPTSGGQASALAADSPVAFIGMGGVVAVLALVALALTVRRARKR